MGAPHGHLLHFHAHSPVHRLPPQVKLVALLLFDVVVVATPRESMAAHAAYGGLLLVVVRVSTVPVGYLARRMLVEVPFVAFALLMPFIATGPRVQVGPWRLSEAGLWAAWALLAKGTLGVLASLVLATTTEPRDIVAGLQRLRLPDPLVQILAFMLRYVEVVGAELRRMQIARDSRAFRGALTLGLADARSQRRGPLHPFLRARRAGASGHAEPRV